MLKRALALALVCAPAAEAHPGFVDITDFSFRPATLNVTTGSLVQWRWDGPDTNHTVTGAEFDSDPGKSDVEVSHRKGDVFSVLFEQPGTYAYACRVHPSMQGKVIVEEPERGDDRPPALKLLGARVDRRGAVVSFRVDERASVLAEARRPGRARVVAEAFRFVRPGERRIRVPVGRGRFSIRLQATDDSGNTSATRRLAVRR